MSRMYSLFFIMALCYSGSDAIAQTSASLNLNTVADKYALSSLEAQNAALDYRNRVLEDENIRKEYLPILEYSLSPFNFNRSLVKLQSPDNGSYSYVEDYSNSSSTALTISQKVPYANGTFSVSSNLSLLSEFSDDRYSFSATPYRISYQQQLLGQYKPYRWEQQINRLKRNKIAKEYARSLSLIQQEAIQLYLKLYVCKRSLEHTRYQCMTSDSLLKVALIRYRQGNLLEKDYVSLELQNTNQHLSFLEENRSYSDAMEELLTYLNIVSKDSLLVVDPPSEEVLSYIQVTDVQMKTQLYSPETESSLISNIEAEKNMYQARLGQWFNASLSLNYGTNQYGSTLVDAYRRPLSQQSVTIGLQIPLFNWGIGRNKVSIARNEYEKSRNKLKQEQHEKSVSIRKKVEEYNYQIETMGMSKKSYELSQKNFEISLFEFQYQRTTVDELIETETAMKESFIKYLNNLASVWNQYYSIRSECLYDYIEDKPLTDVFHSQIINWK